MKNHIIIIFLFATSASLFLKNPLFANELPPSRLSPEHKVLEGKWEHLQSYCENWSVEDIQNYYQSMRQNLYSEFMFINSWDIKYMQSEVSSETPQKPYLFCQRDIYFEPQSLGSKVLLKTPEVSNRNCNVSSFFDGKNQDGLTFTFEISGAQTPQILKTRIENFPLCSYFSWISHYKKHSQ